MQLTRPCLYLLSDYPAWDTGLAGEYDDGIRGFFPDLDFGTPDTVKVLDKIEVTYESLREVPMTLYTIRRFPQTDAGSTYESVSVVTACSQSGEPGVFYSSTSPVWGTAPYATLRTFSGEAHFAVTQGKSFGLGLRVQCDLEPFRLLSMVFRFSVEEPTWRGSGVLRT